MHKYGIGKSRFLPKMLICAQIAEKCIFGTDKRGELDGKVRWETVRNLRLRKFQVEYIDGAVSFCYDGAIKERSEQI